MNGKIGQGTFGDCYLTRYRGEFEVAVKQIKTNDADSSKELKRAKVLHEAEVITSLGDHKGLPHLFGVITAAQPYCLALQFHHVDSRSLTFSEAAHTEPIRSHLPTATNIIRDICAALSYIHDKGFLHNDLKGNNVVLEKSKGGSYNPVIINFGKSAKISKVRLGRPKVNVDDAIRKFPHIAPEVHRGERQSISSDVYSFGYMLARFAKKTNFELFFKEVAKKCLSTCPAKRLTLDEVDTKLKEL